MIVLEAFALVGMSDQRWARDLKGQPLARAIRIGTGRFRYYDAAGRAVGTADHEGRSIVLRDTKGQIVQRIRRS